MHASFFRVCPLQEVPAVPEPVQDVLGGVTRAQAAAARDVDHVSAWENMFEAVQRWVEQHNHYPNQFASDDLERQLAKWLNNADSQNKGSSDQKRRLAEFKATWQTRGATPGRSRQDSAFDIKLSSLKTWVSNNARRPARTGDNVETDWYKWVANQ